MPFFSHGNPLGISVFVLFQAKGFLRNRKGTATALLYGLEPGPAEGIGSVASRVEGFGLTQFAAKGCVAFCRGLEGLCFFWGGSRGSLFSSLGLFVPRIESVAPRNVASTKVGKLWSVWPCLVSGPIRHTLFSVFGLGGGPFSSSCDVALIF